MCAQSRRFLSNTPATASRGSRPPPPPLSVSGNRRRFVSTSPPRAASGFSGNRRRLSRSPENSRAPPFLSGNRRCRSSSPDSPPRHVSGKRRRISQRPRIVKHIPLPPCITPSGHHRVRVRIASDERDSIAGLDSSALQIAVKSTDLRARDANIKKYLAKVLEIRDNKLQFEGPWGANSKNILVKGLTAAQVHERLKNAASPSLESLNITKLHQLNSYIDQKERYESMVEHIVATELELFDSTPKTNCRKQKLLTRREKSRYNKDFLLDSYKALEEKLLSYRKLVAVNMAQVEVIRKLKDDKGWLGKVIIPTDVTDFESMLARLKHVFDIEFLDITRLILGGRCSEKIWN